MRLYLRRKYVWMLDPKLDFINVFLWQSMILNSGFLARLRRTLSASENNHNNDVKALDCFMAYGGAVWQLEHTTMAWKRLPHFWTFMRGFHRTPVRFPHKRPIVRSFGVSFVCNVNKLLKKKSSHWRFQTPKRSWRRDCRVDDLVFNDFVYTSYIVYTALIKVGD